MIRATGCIQHIPAITLTALLTGLTAPSHASLDRDDYALMLRQLDVIDRLTSQLADQSRYHFNHERLRADIHRVRAGVKDFLSPDRAQPRDPVALHGDYRGETVVAP